MTARDRSGAGFWPDGFWSGFEQAGELARERLAHPPRRPRQRCAACERAMPADRLKEQSGIRFCLDCIESGAAEPNGGRFIESAGH